MWSKLALTICVSGYVLAFLLEAGRRYVRSVLLGVPLVVTTALALVSHTLYLYHQALAATAIPLSSMRDWCLVAAWVLAAAYMYLVYFRAKRSFGLFLLPLVLALICVGIIWCDGRPFPREPASRIWGLVHAISILVATVAVLLGSVSGMMYLHQARLLKLKLITYTGWQLPSLEWLRWATARTLGVAVLMLGLGILSGTVLNIYRIRQNAGSVPWSDPVIVSTLLVFVWLLACTCIGAVYPRAREGKFLAVLTILSAVFLAVALLLVVFGYTEHGGIRSGRQSCLPVEQRAVGRCVVAQRTLGPSENTNPQFPDLS